MAVGGLVVAGLLRYDEHNNEVVDRDGAVVRR